LDKGVLVNGDDELDAEFGTAVLERRDLRTYEELDGTLEYADGVQISSSGNGVLTYLAPEGSELERGSVVFRLYRSISDMEILTAEQQVASANAAVAQAELALEVLNAPASPAHIAAANAVVAQAELALEVLNAPASPAQIAAANSAVAQAKLALENLNALATPVQIAAADAAVAQAELAITNLSAPATPAQIAAADAAVAQAELALEVVNAPATPAQIAAATAAVTQAEATLVSAQGGVETAGASLMIARNAFCDGLQLAPICPGQDEPLGENEREALLDLIGDDFMATEANDLLNAHHGYRSAVGSSASAADSLASARTNLAALDDPPTVAELALASEALKSALEQRIALDELPTVAELAQASEALRSAQEQLAALDDLPSATELAQASEGLKSALEQRIALDELPTIAELAQASESLKSARAQRAALDGLPSAAEMAQAQVSLDSAKASLAVASAARKEHLQGPSAAVLMFGDTPAWREFREGMTPGEDVSQLKLNLLSLEYGSRDSLRVDQDFDTEAADAVRKMQADLGLVPTGRILFGDVIFLPGTSVVESSPSSPNLGTAVNVGAILASLIPIERVETRIGQNGDVSSTIESLQRVMTTIEVSDQDLVDVGSEVMIELPDETMVSGIVQEIGSIAVVPQSGNPYLEVSVALDGNTSLPEWTGAPVTVSITKKLADNVLAAPVTSLLALLGGGYALEVLEHESTRLVPVEVEIYADGWVEVTGAGLEAGTEIVVPR
jgi:multidrug efflux pump subunit AcrA (membrane-fusion protein)